MAEDDRELDAEDGAPRRSTVRKYRTSGIPLEDPGTAAELGYASGVGIPYSIVEPTPGWQRAMQRRVKRLGVILLVLLGATLLAKVVSVVTGKDAIVESVGPVLAWVAVVLVAGYLVVAIVRAVSRAFLHTNRRPCVHCGLTITTDDEVCPFCDWSQAEVPDDSGLDSGEPSTADGSWPWSET